MSNTPFMQLYVADYLADTRHLTTEQHGAYLLLLMTMWKAGGRLPNDPRKLARIAGIHPPRWRKIWPDLADFFEVVGGEITQGRLVKEYEKALHKSQLRAEAGSKGGKAKSLKNNDAALANATAKLKHSSEPESELDIKSSNEDSGFRPLDDISEAVAIYNDTASRSGWPQAQKMTNPRRSAVRARLSDCGGVDGWRDAMARAEASDFLCGRTSKPFTGCGFDWLTKQANFTKLMEGNYDNRRSGNRAASDDPALRAIARAAGAF